LLPANVALAVECTPTGAAVMLDGKQVGTCPYSGTAHPGPHTVRVEAAGFAPREDWIAVEAGKPLSRRYVLQKAP